MTEEIIIDGVNVAGCDGLNKKLLPLKQCDLLQFKTKDGGIAGRWCTDHSNCYYKQLKRLEQENKELKVVKEQLKKWNDENLKRQDDMQMWIDLAEEQRKNYRSALEEIRDINKLFFERKYGHPEELIEIDNIINEVLQ